MSKQVSFDRSLYLPDAVEAAALAYAPHAQIDLAPTPDGVQATISATGDHDLDVVVHAFCNHALHETIVRLRQAVLQ